MKTYKSLFLAEGDADPGFDIPLKSKFLIKLSLLGKVYSLETQASDYKSAIRNVIARIARSKGMPERVGELITNVFSNPKSYNLKYKELS